MASFNLLKVECNQLKDYYDNLSWFSKLFFPRELKKKLEENNPSNVHVIHAAFKSTWFFHRWLFRNGLDSFFRTPTISSAAWLFDAKALPEGLERIQQNQERMKMLNDKIQPEALKAINTLATSYLKLSRFTRFLFPTQLGEDLLEYQKEGNKNITPIEVIQSAYHGMRFYHRWFFPNILGQFFNTLSVQTAKQQLKENTHPIGSKRVERNIETLDKSSDPDTLADILCSIQRSEGLSPSAAQSNLDTIRTHRVPTEMINALFLLDQHNEFKTVTKNVFYKASNAQISFNKVNKKLEQSISASNIITLMHRVELLSPLNTQSKENLLAIISFSKLDKIADILTLMERTGLLKKPNVQANFNAIVKGYAIGYEAILVTETPNIIGMENDKIYITIAAGTLQYTLKDPTDQTKSITSTIALSECPGLVLPITQADLTRYMPMILNHTSSQGHTKRQLHNPHYLLTALEKLEAAHLLEGDNAQVNFDLIIANQNPIKYAEKRIKDVSSPAAPASAKQTVTEPAIATTTANPITTQQHQPTAQPIIDALPSKASPAPLYTPSSEPGFLNALNRTLYNAFTWLIDDKAPPKAPAVPLNAVPDAGQTSARLLDVLAAASTASSIIQPPASNVAEEDHALAADAQHDVAPSSSDRNAKLIQQAPAMEVENEVLAHDVPPPAIEQPRVAPSYAPSFVSRLYSFFYRPDPDSSEATYEEAMDTYLADQALNQTDDHLPPIERAESDNGPQQPPLS